MRLGIFDIDVTDIDYIKADSKGLINMELSDGTKVDIQLPGDVDQDYLIDSINNLKNELDGIKRPSRLVAELVYV